MKRLWLRLPEKICEKIKDSCDEKGITVSEFLRGIVIREVTNPDPYWGVDWTLGFQSIFCRHVLNLAYEKSGLPPPSDEEIKKFLIEYQENIDEKGISPLKLIAAGREIRARLMKEVEEH